MNPSLNQQSYIDYVLVSTDKIVTSVAVLDPDVNFPDHLPLIATVLYTIDNSEGNQITSSASTRHPEARPNKTVNYLRWDCHGLIMDRDQGF